MDPRGGPPPPPTTTSLGVSFPSYGALDDAAARATAARASDRGGGGGGSDDKVSFPAFRRSYSLSAIGGPGGGPTPLGRHENLVAVCLLIIALLCLGVMLFVLRPILIPFAVSLLFYYLLQPIVNTLNKPPAVCCREICECCAPLSDGEEEEDEDENDGRYRRAGSSRLRHRRRGEQAAAAAKAGHRGARRPHQQHQHQQQQRGGSGGGASSFLRGGFLAEAASRLRGRRAGYEAVPGAETEGGGAGGGEHAHDEDSDRDVELQQAPPSAQASSSSARKASASSASTASFASHMSSSQRCWFLWYTARCPRGLSVLLAITIALGVFVAFGMIIYHSVQSLQKDWPIYEMGAERAVAKINAWLAKIHVSLNDDLVPYFMDGIKSAIPTLISDVWVAVANGALVLIFLVYLLGSRPQELPPGVWRKIDVHIRRYIRLKTFVCGVVALFVAGVLYLLQVPFAGLFALLTFVLNYIPNFGPIVATVLPLPLVIFSPDLTPTAQVLAFVLPSLGHFFVGYYLEPRLFGEHLEVHPIIIILSLAFWSVLWGVSGMILSVPLIAIMRIVCQNLEHPYARVAVRIMEGRLLDFDESFYTPGPGAGDDNYEDATTRKGQPATAATTSGGGDKSAETPLPIGSIGVAPAGGGGNSG